MRLLTYEDCRVYIQEGGQDRKYNLARLLEKARTLYVPEAVTLVYLKGLFSEDGTEVFLLTKDGRMILARLDLEQQEIEVTVLSLSEIVEIAFRTHYRLDHPIELRIKFRNGREVVFSPKTDANESWVDEYQTYIKKWAETLSTQLATGQSD